MPYTLHTSANDEQCLSVYAKPSSEHVQFMLEHTECMLIWLPAEKIKSKLIPNFDRQGK